MTSKPTFEDIFAAMSAASVGDSAARVAVPADPPLDDTATKFAIALNLLLDDLAFRSAERERTVEALREQRDTDETLIQALSAVGTGFAIADEKGRFTYVNDALCKIFGYSEVELLSMPSGFGLLPPEDIIRMQEQFQMRLRGEPVREHMELAIIRRDQQRVEVELAVKRLAAADKTKLVLIIRDITDRKLAEDALRQSDKKFSVIFDQAAFAAALSRLPDGVIVDVNEAWMKLSGYTKQEMLGKTTLALGINPDPEVRARILAQLQATGSVRDQELTLRMKSGELRLLSVNVDLVDMDGQKYILNSAQDITERKRADDQLYESRTRLSGIVDSAMDAIVSVDAAQRIILFNAAAEKMFGYTAHEIMGQPLEKLIPARFHKAHRKHVETFGLAGVTTRAMGKLGAISISGRRANGEEFPIEASISQVETAGEKVYTVILRDITERTRAEGEIQRLNQDLEHRVLERTAELDIVNRDLKEKIIERTRAEESLRASEERFRAVTQSANDGIIAADSDGKIIFWNKSAQTLFGYSDEQALGQPLTLLMPERYHTLHKEGIARIRAGGERRVIGKTVQLEGKRKDGSEFPLELSLSLWETEQGTFYSGTLRNITARRQAEQAVQELNNGLQKQSAQLEAANKELESFSFSVSHDLRAPLRAVIGYSVALFEDHAERLDDDGIRLLNVIRGEAQRMGQLIDDLLAFSRLGRVSMNRVEVNMTALAKSVFFELSAALPERQIECQIEDLPPSQADRTMLRQVWLNLLANAIKYTGKQPQAVIQVGGYADTGENIYFVKDNGVGFDPRYVDKLFGVFQRLHSAEEFEGTGIGLSIVRRVANRHGGRVWAEGKVNGGATFYFTLLSERNLNV